MKATKVAASMLDAATEDIRITAGRAHVVGVPALGVPLAEVAKMAVKSKELLPDPGLNACTYFNPQTVTWAFGAQADRKSTRLNSSHGYISYAVFCLKKKKTAHSTTPHA